jgi:hypothetical protein
MTRTIGGLYLAPIDKTKIHRVLDIGTGTGVCMESITQYIVIYLLIMWKGP